MSDELKPCPFCGGRSKLKARVSQISCSPCGYFIKEYPQDSLHGEYLNEINDRLIARWNTRTNSAEITRLRAQVERMREALKEIADFNTYADISNEECMRDLARAAYEESGE